MSLLSTVDHFTFTRYLFSQIHSWNTLWCTTPLTLVILLSEDLLLMTSKRYLHKKFYFMNQRCKLHKVTYCQIKILCMKSDLCHTDSVWGLVLPISTLSRSILGVYFTVSTYSCFLWGLGLVSREFDPRKKDKTPDPCFLPTGGFENVEEAKVRYTSQWKPIIHV